MYIDLQDTWQLLKPYLRPSRAWNALKVKSSYWVSRLTGYPVQWGFPVAASIEPTTACNLGCPQCPSGLKSFSRPTGKMSTAEFSRINREIASCCGYLTLYFQGEPYINKSFTDMVAQATEEGIYTATSSNAHFLNPDVCEKTVKAGLKRLIISIDGVDQNTFEKYRVGGDLNKVLQGTENIINAKKKLKADFPKVVWQFIVFRHNESQLPQIKKLAKEFGVDKLAIKTAQIYDFDNADQWLPASELSRYKRKGDAVELKSAAMKHCGRLWSNPVITWDGTMVPCCFDKDAVHAMGNLNEQSVKSIWKGRKFNEFRKKLTEGRGNIEICRNCSEGVKVWL